MSWNVIQGDCLEVMPSLGRRFDLCLTDPPYGIGKDGQLQSTGTHGGRKGYEFDGWDMERPSREAFDLMRRLSREQVIWGGNYFADLLPATGKWLVWDKGQRINQSDGEVAWTSRDGALRIYTLNRVALMQDGAVHPTQKPVELIRWCLSLFPDAQTVIDPYCGAGSVGVACAIEGRDYLGIEQSSYYCDVARARIKRAQGIGVDIPKRERVYAPTPLFEAVA
jgi:DNA modification methylase